MQNWLNLPESERQYLPFFEKDLAADTTHQAIAYWTAMKLHPRDLITGQLYVVHMRLDPKSADFNFLWPMRCLRKDDESVLWHYPVTPEARAFDEPYQAGADCAETVGLVLHVQRDEVPIDLKPHSDHQLN